MNKILNFGKWAAVRRHVAILAIVAGFSIAASAADTITGAVQNQTRGQAAVGDDVILLRLDQGMQEEGRTKTNDQGAFAMKVQFPEKAYLVRTVHQGVNYDQRASAGNTLSVDVFDAAPKVQGVSGNIEIIRTGTKDNLLHVSDMIDIKNESNPPMTQAGERTFDVYLPAKAKMDSVLAASTGKMGVRISATPVPGEPGHFTVNFPLRPGSTEFAFNYDVPYDGHASFRTRLAYPMQQLAVMIPPTMKFTSPSPAFHVLNIGDNSFQVRAANLVKAGEGPSFEISGAGAIPAFQARNQPQAGTPPATRAGSAAVQPANPPANNPAFQAQAPAQRVARGPSPAAVPPAVAVSPREWWILGGAAVLVLGACGFVIWRTRRRSGSMRSGTGAPATGAPTTPLLEALKQQLLDLETSRLQGSISPEEYDKAKQALDGTVQRALARIAAKP